MPAHFFTVVTDFPKLFISTKATRFKVESDIFLETEK